MVATPVGSFEDLPAEVYPHRLSLAFPRIVQRLAELWGKQALDSYFQDLMFDNRGNRHGFPPVILMEILELRTYHRSLMPPVRRGIDTWADFLDEGVSPAAAVVDASWTVRGLQTTSR